MKKVVKVVLLMFVLLIPVMVKADMDAPSVLDYNAIVIKEDGIDFYDNADEGMKVIGHLDKDTRIKVMYERDYNGETYLFATLEGGDTFYVKASYVLPEDEFISPDRKDVHKYDNPVEYVIMADEVDIRKGPSVTYESVGKLKNGFKGKTSYIASQHFIYVEENGVKGWVEMLGKKVLTKSLSIIMVDDVETKCGIIPANTIIDEVWGATAWDGVSLINYNGCEDYVHTFHSDHIFSLSKTGYEETVEGEGKLFTTGKLDQEIMTVPDGAKVRVFAQYGGVGIGPKYAEYNGTKGWLATAEYLANKDNQPPQENPQPVDEPIVIDEPVEDIAPKDEPKEDKTTKKGMDTITIVIICCVSAVAVALAAVATIVLVNKKKKKATTEVAAEETVEAATETPVEEAAPTPVEEPVVTDAPVEQTAEQAVEETPVETVETPTEETNKE